MALRTLHLFAGAGGGIIADGLLGHKPIGAVEIEEYPRKVLLARQLDGSLPRFPVWNDVRTFRADNPATGNYIERLRGIAGNLAICGGFPCQDISAAGKGAGIAGEKSGLWSEFARIIREIRPRYVFVENSPMLTIRGLGTVLGDLAKMGFDARWGVLGAADVGAPMQSERIWIVATPDSIDVEKWLWRKPIRTAKVWGKDEQSCEEDYLSIGVEAASRVAGIPDGMADWVDRTRAIGNGQVPQCAAAVWRILTTRGGSDAHD